MDVGVFLLVDHLSFALKMERGTGEGELNEAHSFRDYVHCRDYVNGQGNCSPWFPNPFFFERNLGFLILASFLFRIWCIYVVYSAHLGI